MTTAASESAATQASPDNTARNKAKSGIRMTARPWPRVSVVVTTRCRPRLLMHCLHALVKQDFPNDEYEIVVVDDSSGDRATHRVVKAVARRASGAPAVQYLASQGQNGVSAARNFGWIYARGSIIAFTQDNAIPARDWLRHGVSALTPNLAAVIGSAMTAEAGAAHGLRNGHDPATASVLDSANCFVHRRALTSVGGFDERFTVTSYEHPDLLFRLMDRFGGEMRIGHESRAIVEPSRSPHTWTANIEQQRTRQFDSLLFKKHPKRYRAHLQHAPQWDHYLIVGAAGVALASAATGELAALTAAAVTWCAFTVRNCGIHWRLPGFSLAALGERLAAAIITPPLSIFWRCVGALRYRVLIT